MAEGGVIAVREENESLRARLRRVRTEADEQARELWTGAAELGAAYAVEKYIAGGGNISIMGLNTRRTLALAAYGAGMYAGGEAGDLLKAVGRGIGAAEAAALGSGRT
jgi:hypothetical protein